MLREKSVICPHCKKQPVTWPEAFFTAEMYILHWQENLFICHACEKPLKSTWISNAIFLVLYGGSGLIASYWMISQGCTLGKKGPLLCQLILGFSFFILFPPCGFVGNLLGGWRIAVKRKPKPRVVDNYPRRFVADMKVSNALIAIGFLILCVWSWLLQSRHAAFVCGLSAFSLAWAAIASQWPSFASYSSLNYLLRKTHIGELRFMAMPIILALLWIYLRKALFITNIPITIDQLFFGLVGIHLLLVLHAIYKRQLTRKS